MARLANSLPFLMRGKTADDIFSFENRCFGDFSINPFNTLLLQVHWVEKCSTSLRKFAQNWSFSSVIFHTSFRKTKESMFTDKQKAAMLLSSKFAFWDATETFPNSLTGNAIWKCFWHCVYTNAREWIQRSPKFFSREIKCSRVWNLPYQSHVNKRFVSFSNFPHHWIKSITA